MSTTLQIGQVLGPYRITSFVGGGGMAEVFEGRHESLGIASRVAIKAILPHIGENPEFSARFLNEALAASLVPHPGVVRFIDRGRTAEGVPFLVMEYLNGESLEARARRVGPRGSRTWVRLLRQLAGSLAAVHAVRIVHRDLKPGNVVLVPDPEVTGGERTKLVDFGIARLLPEHYEGYPEVTVLQTARGRTMGTPLYMAPEQCGGAEEVDDRADVYSLGSIAYELLAVRPLFLEEDVTVLLRRQLFDEPEPLGAIRPDLPAPLVSLISEMLDKLPSRRPPMRQIEERLAALEADMGEGARPAPPVAPVEGHRPTVVLDATPAPGLARTEVLAPRRTEVLAPRRTEVLAPRRTEVLAPMAPSPRRAGLLAVGIGVMLAILTALLMLGQR